MSRTLMLEKIRRACRQAGFADLPGGCPDFPRYRDPVAQFQQEVKRAGGQCFDAREIERLPSALSSVLEQTDAAEIYWEGEDLFHKHEIPFKLRNPEAFEKGFLVFSFHFRNQVNFPLTLSSKRYQRDDLARISLSASSARYGVAETGTVVHEVRRRTGRLLSILPPAHLVFVSEKELLMNHAELFEAIHPGELGSAITLMTGPSRTADIEKTLVIGVHGPKQLFVVLTS